MKAISIFLTAAILLLFISSCADNIGEENGQTGALPLTPQNTYQGDLPESPQNTSQEGLQDTPQDTPLDMSGFAPPSSSNASASSGRAEYEYEEYLDGIVITQYNGRPLIVRVPAEIDGMPVRKIGDEAFATGYFKKFYDVYHRASDAALFNRSTSVEEVYLPDTVIEIGRHAFARCDDLVYIELPDSITTIGESAFGWCNNLEEIKLPANLTSLGTAVFIDCFNLKSIEIPNGVTEISNSMFSGCRNLSSITLPDSITSVGIRSFYECEKLESISFPDGLTSIGEYAFYGCTGLSAVNLGNNLTSIQSSTFHHSNIERIVIPATVESIGFDAFARNSRLRYIEFVSETPPAARDLSFAGIHRFAEAIVPHGSTEYGEPGSRWNGLTVTIKDAD